MCNKNGILVAYGVDSRGEWESVECLDCGKTWVERARGKYLVEDVSDEDFATYMAVKSILQQQFVADWLTDKGIDLTQDEFEELCIDIDCFTRKLDDGEGEHLEKIYENIVEKVGQ